MRNGSPPTKVNSYQLLKNDQRPSNVALLLDLAALYLSNFFLLCSWLTVNFLSLGQPYCEGKLTLKLFTSDQLPRPSAFA